MKTSTADLRRWKSDPVAFIRDVLRDPETGKPFELYPEQVDFLRRGFTLTSDRRLPYPELLFSAPKKSGKTATAAMAAIYCAVAIGGPYAEIYCLANDYEQAASRVFEAASRMVQASPLLEHSAKITANRIEFRSTGSFIQACASDYAGFAGANPTLTICDELWGFVHESSQRLFDEAVPSPARKVSGRLTVTYAGFEGESELLDRLYKRGLRSETVAPDMYAGDGMLMFWTSRPVAPWQTERWLAEMRQSLRPNQYLRMIENRWVTSESSFVEMDWWDACVDLALRPVTADADLSVWVGVDASVKRDSTAIVAAAWDDTSKRVRLVWHRIFQPSPKEPLDFEATIEATLLELRDRFDVREIRFDPYQMVSSSQRLAGAGLPMVEFPQSVPNLTEASTNLYEIIKGRNIRCYADADIRLSISRAVAIETSRGWRIAKERASHKIDVIVALAQAALGAVKAQGGDGLLNFTRAMAEALARGEDPIPGAARELIDTYENALRDLGREDRRCARCHAPLGVSSISGTDGRARHSACC
ncbi:MAG TPA: terminase TerL endonuclease subunit [Candidatus Binataceae bacterium]|nr:terminase TerL endonuclease subunit [Candidatus Binataceae bacterium]HVA80271.1 terminase TerL endonuclease subunit [Candidatus Binataceae bacterium]